MSLLTHWAHKPHHLKNGKKFQNIWGSLSKLPGMAGLIRWRREYKAPTIPKGAELERILPVVPPKWEALAHPPQVGDSSIQLTWIGHSSFLVQMNGCSFLTDPVLSDRCSPVTFAGPKRFVPTPFTIEELAHHSVPVDFVVISHNHYDHLDESSCQQLVKQFPDVHFYVPLGLKSWFQCNIRGTGADHVHELDWGESLNHGGRVDVTFCPAQHWSGRGILDRFKTLWGSWAVTSNSAKYYFVGDTGYCPSFKQVGDHFNGFDVSCIPIGAFKPKWFMSPQHIGPDEAVQLHIDLKSKHSVGMHWGTFELTEDEIDEPPRILREEIVARNLVGAADVDTQDLFVALKHGETRSFATAATTKPEND